MTQQEIDSALEKLQAERRKALQEASAIISRNDRDELLFLLIHQKHLVRVMSQSNVLGRELETKALCGLAEDAYAYAIQLVYKLGAHRSGVLIEDYHRLVEISRFVNNDFELEHFLRYFPFQRVGSRLQNFRIELKSVLADPTMSRIMEYGARHNCDMALRHVEGVRIHELIRDLFPPSFDAEFTQSFGLTTQEVSDFYTALETDVASRITQAIEKMPKLGENLVDATSMESFKVARLVYTLPYDKFISRFGARKQTFRNFLLKLSLNRDNVDEYELRYFAIWRRPFLRLDRKYFTFSPELLGPSVNIGLHYHLLENPSTSDSYRAKRAVQFQARVERVLEGNGLRILDRNVKAKYGKQEIGDIDILVEDADRYYNVECKGVALPLLVYFHDFEYIRDVHLPYLQNKKAWETKVIDRERWLDTKRSSLGLSPQKPLTSLIISDSPEVISHFATTLCLSIREFPHWYSAVREHQRIIGFDEFLSEVLQKRVWVSTDDSRSSISEYLGVDFEYDPKG